MSKWSSYQREEMPRLEPGSYRFEVVNVEEKQSQKGSDMIVVGLRPNGTKITVNHYFVQGEWFNRNITSFFDSTGIEEGNFNFLTWPGAVGAAKFIEDERGYLKVSYFLKPEKAAELPPWVGPVPERQTVTDGFEDVPEDEKLPWEDD